MDEYAVYCNRCSKISGIIPLYIKQNIDFIWYNNYGETLVKYTFYMERSKL